MSRSNCSRLFSLRSRASSSRSFVLNAPGGPLPASTSARCTQARRAVSVRSSSRATSGMLRPDCTSLTASALNSGGKNLRFRLAMNDSSRIFALSGVSTEVAEHSSHFGFGVELFERCGNGCDEVEAAANRDGAWRPAGRLADIAAEIGEPMYERPDRRFFIAGLVRVGVVL